MPRKQTKAAAAVASIAKPIVARQPEAAKLEAARQSEAARQYAQRIFEECGAVADSQNTLLESIILAYCSGITWEDLERVQLKGADGKPLTRETEGGQVKPMTLAQVSTYRSYKSRINAAIEKGATIEPGMTLSELIDAGGGKKKAAGKTRAAHHNAQGEGEGEDKAPAAPVGLNFPDAQAALSFAVKLLREKPEERARYASELREVMFRLAADEAERVKARKAAEARTAEVRKALAKAA